MLELAHVGPHGGSGGVNTEFLIVAIALAVVAVALFLQKSAHPAVSVALLAVAVGLAVGAFAFKPSGPRPTVAIVEPRPGDVVPADTPFEMTVRTSNADSGTHLHLFIDGQLISMPNSLTPKISLDAGPHEIAVRLSDANHQEYSPQVVDTIEVTARPGQAST